MRWRVLLLLLASFLLLLVGGGAVFHFLETRHEQQVRVASAQYLDAVLADKQCLSRSDLEALVRVVLTAYDQGVRADAAGTNVTVAGASAAESATNWDFASSVFFAGTVATTIGYGHIAPATPGGRAFCAVFALAAIPLCLVLLAAIGDKLKAAYGRAHRTLTHRCANRLCADVLRTALVSSAGLVAFLFLPSAVFVAIEGWTYGEALYYSFVTLTTIGFGDFVVGTNRGQQYRTLYRLCAWLWILAGLAWLSVIISLVQDVYQGVLDRVEERVDGGGQDMAEESQNIVKNPLDEDGSERKENLVEMTSLQSNEVL